MGLAERADLVARLNLDGNFEARLRSASGALGRFQGGMGRVGRGIGQIGTGFARAGLVVGGAVVAGLTGAAKAAIDFEDAFAGVVKTVDEAELKAAGLSFESLERSFRDLATEIPIAATEFARIGEIAGQLGIQANDIVGFTEVVAKLGVTTDLTADAAADSLGRIGTILSFTGKDYEEFADALVNLGNKAAGGEAEIIELTKRFAASGKQAGLTTSEILALSSALTAMAINPEAGGSALSRIFSNMTTEIANATAKGKAFAAITGDSLAKLKKRLDQGDALGILHETLEGISVLSRTEAASVLKALGITGVRDRDAILKMSQNLDIVDENLQNAANSAGALEAEATKRFDTIASKIQVLKNNVIEAGISIGEGMLPSIGRATDKLIAFLKVPGNQQDLKNLGEDIGESIDKIDWGQVIGGIKTFVGIAKTLLDILSKIPIEITAAVLAFGGLNKLSGGLIGAGAGNVIGGLAETAARSGGSRLPGVGKLFAQPVFVTNWPMGGMGGTGAPGVAPVGGGGGIVGTVGAAAGGLLIVDSLLKIPPAFDATIQGLDAANHGNWAQAASATQTLASLMPPWMGGTAAMLEQVATDLDKGIEVTPQGLSPDERQEFNDTKARDAKAQALFEKTRAEIEAARIKAAADAAKIAAQATATKVGVGLAKAAIVAKQQATGSAIVSAERAGTGAIVGAIRANRPIVSVNTTVHVAGGNSYQTASYVNKANKAGLNTD